MVSVTCLFVNKKGLDMAQTDKLFIISICQASSCHLQKGFLFFVFHNGNQIIQLNHRIVGQTEHYLLTLY